MKIYKYGDNVDTDVIIPARYLNAPDEKSLASHCMEDIDADFACNIVDREERIDQLVLALLFEGPLDGVVELLVDERYREQECRVHHLHVFRYVFESPAERHGCSHEHSFDHGAGALVCVMYRKHAEEDVARDYLEVGLRDEYIRAEVPVREHDTLAYSRGAGCEDDRNEVGCSYSGIEIASVAFSDSGLAFFSEDVPGVQTVQRILVSVFVDSDHHLQACLAFS